jgi:cobalt-zinc-cadmium efflux system membrane fusion protein
VRVRGADPKLVAEGKVVYIAPFGQTANQTLTARALIDNKDRLWPPGLYVSAEVTVAESAAALAVRSAAIQTLEEQTVVFVRTARGFEPRPIRVGRSDGNVVEVLSGLAPEEQYVARNSFILKAELGKGEAEHGH